MGIPKFYRWLSERYPLINQAVDQNEFNMNIDYLYLDVNGIIHNATHSGHEMRLKPSDSDVAAAVVGYIEVILSMVKPRKLLYIAIDGVPPRAKVNQQRKRRFRAAKELQEAQETNKKFNKGDDQDLFDSNCITPGTEFMQNLDKNLKYMIAYKIETERLWHNLDVIYSGYDVPGEGEHKLMEFIREQKRKDQLDPNSYHCIYGLDADLIILSLSLHMSNFVLLREQIDFLSFKNVTKITTREIKSKTWQFTHISLLREYIKCDILSDLPSSSTDPNVTAISSGEYDFERIIDDFTFLITLCGNDFIPELPSLDIKQGSLDKMLEIYKNILPNFKGQYILEKGLPNKIMMKRLFSQLGIIEEESMVQIQSSLEKTHNHPRNKTQASKFQREDEHKRQIMNKLGKNASMKNIYYLDKFNIEPDDIANRKKVVQSYIDGLFWVYNYYYRGCASWDWFYPYHYAPMFSDLSDYILDYQDITFKVGNPVDPFIQLLCCLPPQSAKLLPISYHWLMTDPKSPLKMYYPDAFDIDPNGKVNDWEGVELIPFIDINEIMKVVEQYHPDKNVNQTENLRNHCNYFTMEYRYDSTLNPYPLTSPVESVMPSIDHCRVYCKKLEMHLPDPHNLPVIDPKYFTNCRNAGLPSLFNIPVAIFHDFVSINIFGIPSRKETVIVDLLSPSLSHSQVCNILGYHCSCGYPSTYPAVITKITFPTKKYFYDQYFTKYHTLLPNYFHDLKVENMNPREQDNYHQTISFLQDNWLKGFQHQLGTGGINIQNISCICEVYPVIGIAEINGLRQWKYASEPLIFPFELISFNENPKFLPPTNIPFLDKFHINDKVIVTEPIYYKNNMLLYGKEGKITSVDCNKLNVTVDIDISEYEEPKFGYTLIKSAQTEMMTPKDACHRLKISIKALFRLIGSVVFDREFDVGLNMMIHKNNSWYILPGYISMKYDKNNNNNNNNCWKDPKETSLLISGQLIENGNGNNGNNDNNNNSGSSSSNYNNIMNSYFISTAAFNVIQLYVNRYYDVIDLLENSDFVYFDSNKTWGREGKIFVEEITKWKMTLVYTNIRLIPSNSMLFTSDQVKILEYSTKAVEKLEKSLNKQRITVNLSDNKLVGQSELFENVVCNSLVPKLGSRIVSLGRNNIPFGLKGTVVGIHPSTGYIEVVFDKKFLSGSSLNGLCRTGYGKIVSHFDVLNISDIPTLSS